MSEIAGNLPKPQLRGLLHKSIRRNLAAVAVSLTIVGCCMKFIHNDGRKAKYAEFYKNYDIEKEFETMRKKGLFDSCPTD